MRRIRRSAVPTALLAGALLFGAAACSDDGDDLEEVDPAVEETTAPGSTEDPLTGGTETETTG